MERRQAGAEVGVALVRHDHDRAGLGDGEVRAADAGVGREETPAQVGAGKAREALRVVLALGRAHAAVEQCADLAPRLVDGGHDQVRRRLAGELHDALAEVGVHDLDAARLEVRIQAALLGEHRLALHHPPRAARREQLRHDAAERGGVRRPVHVRARLARALLEGNEQLVEVVERERLERGGALAQRLPVGHFGGRRVAAPSQVPHRRVVLRQLAARGQVGARARVEARRHASAPTAPFARISARWIARGP